MDASIKNSNQQEKKIKPAEDYKSVLLRGYQVWVTSKTAVGLSAAEPDSFKQAGR